MYAKPWLAVIKLTVVIRAAACWIVRLFLTHANFTLSRHPSEKILHSAVRVEKACPKCAHDLEYFNSKHSIRLSEQGRVKCEFQFTLEQINPYARRERCSEQIQDYGSANANVSTSNRLVFLRNTPFLVIPSQSHRLQMWRQSKS